MEIRNITLDEVLKIPKLDKGLKFNFYQKDGLFYKMVSLQRNLLPSEQLVLQKLEDQLDMLDRSGIFKIDDIYGAIHKLYHNGMFIGYTSLYLDNFAELINASTDLNNSQKINLLINLSQVIKKMHDHNIAHTDIYSDNVLTNGKKIGIIDLDEAVSFKEGDMVSYYSSPYVDIAGINNLVLRLLTKEGFGRSKNNSNPSLPKDILKYIKYYNENNHVGLVEAQIPSEYPHDWLNSLKPYIGEKGSFQRRI